MPIPSMISPGVVVKTIETRMQEKLLHILNSKRCIRILDIISREDHTASSLSDRLNIKKPTLSHYLQMLKEVGVIDVNPCLRDLRIKRLSLSSRGKALLLRYNNEILFQSIDAEL